MALDVYSAILGWLNQGTGNNNNSWGDNCDNSIFPIFEKAIAGVASRAVTGGTLDLDDNAPPAGPTAALEMIQAFSGTLASDQIVLVPNLSKLWLVYNGTSGAFTLKFKTASGDASAAIPQGGWCFVFCDGGDGIFVGMSTTLRDVQFLGPDGTLALPGLSFASEPGLGIRRVSAGVMAITVAGVDIITISGSSVTLAAAASNNIVSPGTESTTAAIRAPDGWYFEYGQNVARATDMPLMNAITETFTADTNGTVTLSNVSKDLRNLGLEGSVLEGVGIFTGATIVSIGSSTIVMSAAATNTATAGAVRAFPYGNGNGSTTFTLPNAQGTVAAGRTNMSGSDSANLTGGSALNASLGTQNRTLGTTNVPPVTPSGSVDISHDHYTGGLRTGIYIGGGGGTIEVPRIDVSGSKNAGTTDGFSSGTTTRALSMSALTYGSGGVAVPFSIVQPTRIRNVIIKR